MNNIVFVPGKFLSTLSLRRATKAELKAIADRYISIHALLAESDPATSRNNKHNMISIHALLAESDVDASAELRR